MTSYDYQLIRKPIHIEQVRRMPGYDQAKHVPRVPAGISQAEFMESYWAPGKPAVIVGGVRHWKAFNAWRDDDYLKTQAGEEQILVSRGLVLDLLLMRLSDELASGKRISPRITTKGFYETMKVREYLDKCTTHWNPEAIYYARNIAIPPQILDDTEGLPFFGRSIQGKSIFLGRQSFTDSHEHDGSDAFACLVRGSKEFILHPPDRSHYSALYADARLRNWSPVRFFDVDLIRFPLFAKTVPTIARLQAGDVLYIPNPYWHSVVSLDDELECNVACWVPARRMHVWKHPASRRACVYKARARSVKWYGSARQIVQNSARQIVRNIAG